METNSTTESTERQSKQDPFRNDLNEIFKNRNGLYHAIYPNWNIERSFILASYRDRFPETHEKLKKRLCLTAQDVADVYLLSLISKIPKSEKKTGQDLDDLDALQFEKYQLLDHLAVRHLLSGVTWLMSKREPEPVRETSNEFYEQNTVEVVERDLRKVAEMVLDEKSEEEILDGISVGKILSLYLPYYKQHQHGEGVYRETVEALQRLNESRLQAKITGDDGLLSVSMTFLHNSIHHCGGLALEEILAEGEKEKAYDLMLRFASAADNGKFAIASAQQFSSSKSRILYNKLSRLLPPFKVPELIPSYSNKEQGYYLAQELVTETRDRLEHPKPGEDYRGEFFFRAVKSLEKYPYFDSVQDLILLTKSLSKEDGFEYREAIRFAVSVLARSLEVEKGAFSSEDDYFDYILANTISQTLDSLTQRNSSSFWWENISHYPEQFTLFRPRTEKALINSGKQDLKKYRSDEKIVHMIQLFFNKAGYKSEKKK